MKIKKVLLERKFIITAVLIFVLGLVFVYPKSVVIDHRGLKNNPMTFSEFRQRMEEEKEAIQIDYSEVKKVISFAVIGDVHIGAWHKGELYLSQALDKAKQKGVAFVVVLGDLTQNGSREEFALVKKVLDYSGMEYYVVPGNHDIGAEAGEDGLNNFREFFGQESREIVFDFSNPGEIKRAKLFLLDTAQWRGTDNPMLLDSQQWKWLKNNLADKGYDPEELKLVFSQAPFDSLSLTDSHYLREFVCAGFVDGFFGANNHRTEFFRRNCPLPLNKPEMEGLFYMFPTFKVGSLFKPQSEFPGFLIIHYFNNRYFEIERVLLGELDENF